MLFLKIVNIYIYIYYCLKFQKSLNIYIGAVLKNPEMLKVVPDHFNTKKMFKCS